MSSLSTSLDLSRPTPLKERARAASIHLACCALIAAAVLALVHLGWYPPPLDAVSGVGPILMILIAADVVLGPIATLVVFDRRKKSLKLDLSMIAALQLAALAYGLYTLHEGRPTHLVFVKDRFEFVAPADLDPAHVAAAAGNPHASSHPLRPRIVAAAMPEDADERQRMMFEAIATGRDVQHHPRLYREYASQAHEAAARAEPLHALAQLNPEDAAAIEALPASLGLDAERVGYLPLKGPARDGALIVRADSGEVLRITGYRPW